MIYLPQRSKSNTYTSTVVPFRQEAAGFHIQALPARHARHLDWL